MAAEFALVSARRTQIEPRAEAGNRFARTTLRAMENMSEVIAVNQLGITVCSLVLGAVAEPTIAHLIEPVAARRCTCPSSFLHPVAFAVGLSIVVFLHVVMGEMIPKNIALAGPDRAALVLGTPVWAFVTLMRPVIKVINAVARGLLRLVGVRLMDEVSSTYTREEVAALVEESRGEGLLQDDEYDRLAGALGFTERTVAAVLMPPGDADDRRPHCHRRRGRGRLRGHRLQPVPRHRSGPPTTRPTARSATCTSRTCSSPTRRDATARSSRAGSGRSRRSAPATRCTTPSRSSSAGGRTWPPSRDDDGAFVGLATLEDVIEELVGEIRDAAPRVGASAVRRVRGAIGRVNPRQLRRSHCLVVQTRRAADSSVVERADCGPCRVGWGSGAG